MPHLAITVYERPLTWRCPTCGGSDLVFAAWVHANRGSGYDRWDMSEVEEGDPKLTLCNGCRRENPKDVCYITDDGEAAEDGDRCFMHGRSWAECRAAYEPDGEEPPAGGGTISG